jgi:hypothetical protein
MMTRRKMILKLTKEEYHLHNKSTLNDLLIVTARSLVSTHDERPNLTVTWHHPTTIRFTSVVDR